MRAAAMFVFRTVTKEFKVGEASKRVELECTRMEVGL